MNARIGIDLGGSKIEAAVIGAGGEFLDRHRVATPSDNYEAILDAVLMLVERARSRAGVEAPVGLGMPGIVSPATGLVKNANTVCLNGRPFARDLELRIGARLRIENDANCMVLSETLGGVAADSAVVFGVIIGTGTGGGIFANQGLIRGVNAISGEWGHNPVPWAVPGAAARACYCGRNNCVETFLSGAGLVRTYNELGGASLATVEAIMAAVADGEAVACAARAEYASQLARSLSVVVNILDPTTIVLAGGLSNIANLCADVNDLLTTLCFTDALKTTVKQAQFGDSSGVRGAACLWSPQEMADV